MKYKAYIKQSGEGCDYMIGCGSKVIDIVAPNMSAAKLKLINEYNEYYRDSDSGYDVIELYEINDTYELPITDLEEAFREQEMLVEQQQLEEAERIEFERLKNKYGG